MPNQDGDAAVTPNQPWNEDGTALVSPYPPFPDPAQRILPLDNRPAGDATVARSDYPRGLVIIPTGHEPASAPAVLPITASSGDKVGITSDTFVNWPDGFVVWFFSQ